MDFNIKGKTALITGSGSGLSLETPMTDAIMEDLVKEKDITVDEAVN